MSKWIQTHKVLRLVLSAKFSRGSRDGVDADMALEVPHIRKDSVKQGLWGGQCVGTAYSQDAGVRRREDCEPVRPP